MNSMDVFERAMHLSDNGDESTTRRAATSRQAAAEGADPITYWSNNLDIGETDTSDNQEYKLRTLAIINMLVNELYPYSDTCVKVPGKRSVHPPLTNLAQEIDLDDYCCGLVLPYGLAARLFTDENPTQAGFYEQEYERLLAGLKRGEGMTASSEPIDDVYGGSYIDGEGHIQYLNTGGFGFEWVGRW